MTEMCDPCPRTPVTHVPSRYRSKLGHPERPTPAQRRPCRMGTPARPLLFLPVTFHSFWKSEGEDRTGKSAHPTGRWVSCRRMGRRGNRVLRGGSWSNNARNTRTTNRNNNSGFRVVLDGVSTSRANRFDGHPGQNRTIHGSTGCAEVQSPASPRVGCTPCRRDRPKESFAGR